MLVVGIALVAYHVMGMLHPLAAVFHCFTDAHCIGDPLKGRQAELLCRICVLQWSH